LSCRRLSNCSSQHFIVHLQHLCRGSELNRFPDLSCQVGSGRLEFISLKE
jgi:hypothetical protein